MNITVAENISGDFYWVPAFFVSLASNPIFSLFVGIVASLMIWRSQTILSHKLIERDEKRKLYRSFISLVDAANAAAKTNTKKHYYDVPELVDLWALEREISVVGCEKVSERVVGVVAAVALIQEASGPSTISSDGVERDLQENFYFEVRGAISAMKKSLS